MRVLLQITLNNLVLNWPFILGHLSQHMRLRVNWDGVKTNFSPQNVHLMGYSESKPQDCTTSQTIGPHCVRSTAVGCPQLHSPPRPQKIKFSWLLYTRWNGFHTLIIC